MPTLDEILERYRNYSDSELLDVYSKIEEYTEVAKEALKIIIAERGGIESLKNRVKLQINLENEVARIKHEIFELFKQGKDVVEIKNQIKINYISDSQLTEIISEVSTEYLQEKVDTQIKPRTVLGSIVGGFIGGTIGGIIWCIQLLYTNHIFFILIIGLALLSYAFIRLFTKQSKNNTLVLIMTLISVVYAITFGQIVFEIFVILGSY